MAAPIPGGPEVHQSTEAGMLSGAETGTKARASLGKEAARARARKGESSFMIEPLTGGKSAGAGTTHVNDAASTAEGFMYARLALVHTQCMLATTVASRRTQQEPLRGAGRQPDGVKGWAKPQAHLKLRAQRGAHVCSTPCTCCTCSVVHRGSHQSPLSCKNYATRRVSNVWCMTLTSRTRQSGTWQRAACSKACYNASRLESLT